jgi:hypothetical protein
MLRIYVDDSSIHDRKTGTPEIIGHGGAIADFDSWKRLETDWRAALAEDGLSWFHYTDYKARAGAYGALSDDRYQALLPKLLKIIKDNVAGYIGYALPAQPGKRFVETYRDSVKEMIYRSAGEARDKSGDGTVALVFADHPELSWRRVERFVRAIRLAMPELSSYTGAVPQVCPALQAADILAHEFVRWESAPYVSAQTSQVITYLYSDAPQTFRVSRQAP